tara:strand:+ start:982 stop:1122 length:141 start_codon:yes stop_codon:yes gene_type:complete
VIFDDSWLFLGVFPAEIDVFYNKILKTVLPIKRVVDFDFDIPTPYV